MKMTKQVLIDLCADRKVNPQDAFNALAEAMADRSNPDLSCVASVTKWLDKNLEKLEPVS